MKKVIQMLQSLKRTHLGDQAIIDVAIGRLALDERWAVHFADGRTVKQEAGRLIATRGKARLYEGHSMADALRALVADGAPEVR